MQAKQICLLASQIAKGGTGMVAIAGQGLNAVLEELKLVRNLKMNRVTQTLNVSAGSNGPFLLEADYLRTYDMFFPLAANGETQFLTPITMEQYDAEVKFSQTADYPYEFATDLSTQALAASGAAGSTGVAGVTVVSPGIYTSIPAVGFSGGVGSGASATAHVGITGISGFTSGASYALGNLVTLVGGTFTRPWKAMVSTVDGSGAVLVVQVIDYGDYITLPSAGSATTTNGAGAGFIVNPLLFNVSSVVVTASGLYTSAPAATLSGGGGAPQGTLSVQFGSTATQGGGQLYIYPMSATPLAITHRYLKNQPDLVSPETSTTVPWFPHSQYLIDRTAWFVMGITGDDRRDSFLQSTEALLRPYLIMEGDEQQAVQAMRLDPRRFRANRGLRPTKLDPY